MNRFLCFASAVLFAGGSLPLAHATKADPTNVASTRPDIDEDNDGLTNQEEAEAGTYPYNAYSDADSVMDGLDGCPLDPLLMQARLPRISGYAVIDLGEGSARKLNNNNQVLVMTGSACKLWTNGTSQNIGGIGVDLDDSGMVAGYVYGVPGSTDPFSDYITTAFKFTSSTNAFELLDPPNEQISTSPTFISSGTIYGGSTTYWQYPSDRYSQAKTWPGGAYGIKCYFNDPQFDEGTCYSPIDSARDGTTLQAIAIYQGEAPFPGGYLLYKWYYAVNQDELPTANNLATVNCRLVERWDVPIVTTFGSDVLIKRGTWQTTTLKDSRKANAAITAVPSAINSRGEVLLGGNALWRNGGVYSISELIHDPAWSVSGLSDINDHGVIAGTATKLSDNTTHAVMLVPVDITINASWMDKPPRDGLVMHTALSVLIQLSDIPQQYFPAEVENIKWYSRKLKWDGTYENWQDMGESARGVKFNYTCTELGIFQVKCEWTVGTQTITTIFERDHDDSNTGSPAALKKGDPNSFGVVETSKQEDIRNAAKAHLGKTDYAAAGSLPLWSDPVGLFTGNITCNVFVADMCDEGGANVDPPVLGVYVGSPPSANNWSGMPDVGDPSAPHPIPNFTLLPPQTYPQPGFIVASGFETGASGHSGIVDYDGQWISAGPSNVNRKAEFITYKRHFVSGVISPAGQRRYDGN